MEGASIMRQDGVLQKKAALKTSRSENGGGIASRGGGSTVTQDVVINNCAYQLRPSTVGAPDRYLIE